MKVKTFVKIAVCGFSVLMIACSSIDTAAIENKVDSYHSGYQEGSLLDSFFKQDDFDTSTHSGFFPLKRGHDAFLARLALIESAEVSLDLQYYIYREDETGQLLTWRLYEAAQRGVKVRLLLDDFQKRSDRSLARLNAHPNIEVRLFNPNQFRSVRGVGMATDFERLNRRMHNKSLTADTVASIVGGRNVGNEYFSFSSAVEFGDLDLLLYGNTVEQIADQFDLYWNSDFAVPVEAFEPNVTARTDEEVQAWLLNPG